MSTAVKVALGVAFFVMMFCVERGARWLVEGQGMLAGLAAIIALIGLAYLIERRGKSRPRS